MPLALGMVMLTGCSNESNEEIIPAAKDFSTLYVTTEELQAEDGLTRSYLSRDFSIHMYTPADEMRVYDNILHKYDPYKFYWNDESQQKGVFKRKIKTSYIEAAQWALYPRNDVTGHWDLDETGDAVTIAEVRIGADEKGNLLPIVYDGTYQASDASKTKPLFTDFLPRWGQVAETADGTSLETHLSYLTGVLRLQLAGIAGHADHLKVQMLEGMTPLNIAGSFNTILTRNDVKQIDACVEIDNHREKTGGDHIIIDLTQASGDLQGADASKAVVFVPLVTTPGKKVDIVVSYSNDGGTTYTEFKRFKNKTIQRAKVYGNSVEYDFTK